MDDNLVLVLLGNLFVVNKHGLHLIGVGGGFGQFSELDKLVDLGQGLVLKSSEFHVLLVEHGPFDTVDINCGFLPDWLCLYIFFLFVIFILDALDTETLLDLADSLNLC